MCRPAAARAPNAGRGAQTALRGFRSPDRALTRRACAPTIQRHRLRSLSRLLHTHGLTLTAVNASGRQAGLAPGMRLADARAICPALLTAPATRADADFLEALARWSSRYSPQRGRRGRALARHHRHCPSLRRRTRPPGRPPNAALPRRVSACGSVSPKRWGPRTPWPASRRPPPCIAAPGTLSETLAPFPIEALRLAPGNRAPPAAARPETHRPALRIRRAPA